MFAIIIATHKLLRVAVLIGIVALSGIGTLSASGLQAPPDQTRVRKLKSGKPPVYPEIARKMNIQGLTRVRLTIAPQGAVIGVKELGGNPILLDSLIQAVRKWKYEAADRASELEVKFEFR
jgi:TonB family protein